MLQLTDRGCSEHPRRHIILDEFAASMVAGMLVNLPWDGRCYTYICEHGNTHRLSYQVQKGLSVENPLGMQARNPDLPVELRDRWSEA